MDAIHPPPSADPVTVEEGAASLRTMSIFPCRSERARCSTHQRTDRVLQNLGSTASWSRIWIGESLGCFPVAYSSINALAAISDCAPGLDAVARKRFAASQMIPAVGLRIVVILGDGRNREMSGVPTGSAMLGFAECD